LETLNESERSTIGANEGSDAFVTKAYNSRFLGALGFLGFLGALGSARPHLAGLAFLAFLSFAAIEKSSEKTRN